MKKDKIKNIIIRILVGIIVVLLIVIIIVDKSKINYKKLNNTNNQVQDNVDNSEQNINDNQIDSEDNLNNNKTNDDINADNTNDNNNNNNNNNQLTSQELKNIESYINQQENNAFILMEYSNPEEILTIKNNVKKLAYSINSSNYSKQANPIQSNIIWNGSEPQVSTRVSTVEDLFKYIKEKTNYDIPNEKIKLAFNNYFNDELNLYYFLISDSIFEERKIIESYKENNKYHIILDNYSNLILITENDKYYFYSCNNCHIN